MTIEDIARIITSLEKKYPVGDWEVNGVKVWPFLRIENYALMSYKSVNSNTVNTKSLNYVKTILNAKFNKITAEAADQKMNSKLQPTDVVFLGDGVSFTKLNNVWYDKFCDPIYDHYKSKNYKTFRFDTGHNFFVPRYSPSKFVQNAIDNIVIKSLLVRKLFKKRDFEVKLEGYQDFINDPEVVSYLPSLPSEYALVAKVHKIIKIKNYYLRALLKLKPKLAYIVSYYYDAGMAFILACDQLNIKTIDIQHGVQGDLHLAYGMWEKVPLEGYASMPDYFWVWSATEKIAIDKWSVKLNKHRAAVGGNLFAQMWKDDESQLVKFYDEIYIKKCLSASHCSILLTLSPGMTTDELMLETWKTIEVTQNTYNWCIRLHPVMIADKASIINLLNERGIFNFELDLSTTLPLYTILRNVDLHITTQSSVVVEAIEFGLPNIVTSKYGESLYKNLLGSNLVSFCYDAETINFEVERILGLAKGPKVIKHSGKDVFAQFEEIITGGK